MIAVPKDIQDTQFEKTIFEGLFLIGNDVSPENIETCQRMKHKDWVIVKFPSRKKRNSIILKRKI